MQSAPWHSRHEESKKMCRRSLLDGAIPMAGEPAPTTPKGAPDGHGFGEARGRAGLGVDAAPSENV